MGHQGTIFLKGIKTVDNSIAELFSKTNETIILGLETVDSSTAHILSHPHGVLVYSSKILEQVRKLVNGI